VLKGTSAHMLVSVELAVTIWICSTA